MRIPVCLGLLLLSTAPLGAAEATGPAPAPGHTQDTDAVLAPSVLQDLGKGLALALGSFELRDRLAQELDRSPYVEARIPFKRLLAQDATIREEILWYAKDELPWETVQQKAPELELYFPLQDQRESWDPAQLVGVAVPISGSDRYRLYRSDGTVATLDAKTPPAAPTLLLARSEIDFDDAGSALAGGKRTGTHLQLLAAERALAIEPVPEREVAAAPLEGELTSTSSGVDTSRHTYLTYFRIPNDHDPLRGSMEIEVFGGVDGSYESCKRFTDIEEDTDYFLPAPGATGSKKIAFAVPTGTNTVDVKVYEDDDTGCVIKSSDDFLGVANIQITGYGSIFGTSNGNASVRVGTQNTTCGDSVCEGDESSSNCCADCATCGDGVCQTICGEDGSTCSSDCPVCGNGICEKTKGESSFTCPEDCSSCGNGICEFDKGEDSATCPADCCEGHEIECPA